MSNASKAPRQHLVHLCSVPETSVFAICLSLFLSYFGNASVQRNRRHLLPGLILWKAPTVDVKIFAIVAGNRFHLAREAAHPPDSLAIRDRVSRELKRFRNDNLLRSLFWLIDDWC